MRKIIVILSMLLVLSIAFNLLCVNYITKKNSSQTSNLLFFNANSRDTFMSMHNVKAAQEAAQGKGITVGILDAYFGYEKHRELYKGGMDFLDDPRNFNEEEQHGYWMALALKEVAPKAEVYALNVNISNEKRKLEAMVKAIDWAIENKLDILTYSSARFSPENEKLLNEAINKAVANNIVTIFIHCPNPNNILPDGMFSEKYDDSGYNGRSSDINIFHFDYNVISPKKYNDYIKPDGKTDNGGEIPFYSISSTSQITGGFVAILKSINNNLKPDAYKKILIESSRKMNYNGQDVPKVVDMGKAVELIKAY